MNRLALVALIILTGTAHAADKMPSRFRSACERYLMDSGWINPSVRAQINNIDGEVRPLEGNLVAVSLFGANNPIRFARTRRNVNDMVLFDKDFPRRFFTPENFADKKVLDLACGEGRATEQLLREGVDVTGLDIHLTPYMKSKPYFVQASAHETGLPSESFDIIFTTQGPFTYLEHDPVMMLALMKEARRLLKPGGVLRISSVGNYQDHRQLGARPEIDLRDTIYTDLPERMRLKSWPDRDWFFAADPEGDGHFARYWLEIEKTR